MAAALWIKVLLGMQPAKMQSPPRRPASTMPTLAPLFMAVVAAVKPPLPPPPTTNTSKS